MNYIQVIQVYRTVREYITLVIWCYDVVRLSPKEIPIFFFANLQFRDYHFHGGREDRLCCQLYQILCI